MTKRLGMRKQESALIIVDNEEKINDITEVLEDLKYRVILARKGNEARLKFGNEVFHFVLIDMEVKGLSGPDFVEGIRRKEKLRNVKEQIPILIIGEHADEYSTQYASVDHVKYLETPFSKLEFKKKLLTFTGNSDVIFKNTRMIEKDEFLITEGGTSHEMFWILSGKFVITKLNQDNKNIIIGEVFPGELVGEMSFLDSLPRSASVKALEESEVLVIPHKKFIDVLDNQPRWFKSLMQTMSQRLRDANKKIARKNVDLVDTINESESDSKAS